MLTQSIGKVVFYSVQLLLSNKNYHSYSPSRHISCSLTYTWKFTFKHTLYILFVKQI